MIAFGPPEIRPSPPLSEERRALQEASRRIGPMAVVEQAFPFSRHMSYELIDPMLKPRERKQVANWVPSSYWMERYLGLDSAGTGFGNLGTTYRSVEVTDYQFFLEEAELRQQTETSAIVDAKVRANVTVSWYSQNLVIYSGGEYQRTILLQAIFHI